MGEGELFYEPLAPGANPFRQKSGKLGDRGRAGFDGKDWHGAGIRHSVAGSREQASSLHATVP